MSKQTYPTVVTACENPLHAAMGKAQEKPIRFSAGPYAVTPGASEECVKNRVPPAVLFELHVRGDWGSVDKEDIQLNEIRADKGGMVMSVFKLPVTGKDIWVISDPADQYGRRTATTLLMPDEY